jgi:hypothetical protein
MIYCLRIEGVNFDVTVYDTSDPAVIRAASLLLEASAGHVLKALAPLGISEDDLVYSGGSEAVFEIRGGETQAGAAQQAAIDALAQDPFCHLSFVVDTGMGPDLNRAIDVATARNRTRQFQQWTVPDYRVDGAVRQDSLDNLRGATGERDAYKGWLSPATRARLEYGRKYRRRFFEDLLGASALRDVAFCGSFQDIVQGGPDDVPEAIRNKIAVIHFDGDGFGAVARAIGPRKMGIEVRRKLDEVLRRVVGDAVAAEASDAGKSDGVVPHLRLEVLVWGGDDITLVVPACRALLCLRGFFETARDWEIEGHRLSFTAGAAISQVKTPIRSLTRVAGEAVDLAKAHGARGTASFDIFESAALPESGDLEGHRERTFVRSADAGLYAFPGSELGALDAALAEWKHEAGRSRLSRTQIHSVLRAAAAGASDEDLEIRENDYHQRILGDRGHTNEASLPHWPDRSRSRTDDLYWVDQLWDYATQHNLAQQIAA